MGSVIGPTMWNIFFDNLLYLSLPPSAILMCFADNTLLVTSDDSYDDNIFSTNHFLSLINNWICKSYLLLNLNNIKALSFTSINLPRLGFNSPYFNLNQYRIVHSFQLKYVALLSMTNFLFSGTLSISMGKQIL